MKLLNLISFFCITILLSSCARTLTVIEGDKKVGGIPFYSKKVVIEQQTKYLYDWQVLTLTREEEKSNKSSVTTIISARIKKSQNLAPLETALKKLNTTKDEKDLNGVLTEIKKLNTVDLTSNTITTANVIENNWKYVSTVDYSKQYYLNSKIPWFGTSTISQKLASDGTLTEASGTTDSQLDELVGTVVGLATPLSSIKVAEIENSILAPEVTQEINVIESFSAFSKSIQNKYTFDDLMKKLSKNKVTYKLKIEEKGYIYTFIKKYDDATSNSKTSAGIPITFNLNNGNYTRSNWPQTKKEEQKKEDKPTINVSGSIELPKQE
ncbi:hypothetical protein [uncultured Dokdonia sp.]|uniref:hypothetical protein n=1 Tax=uncultured Dokdonia sp. TaxID=575653 RepID=UPI00260E899C|nr:hypothetical protein [uncultured Dokdonia sp.]